MSVDQSRDDWLLLQGDASRGTAPVAGWFHTASLSIPAEPPVHRGDSYAKALREFNVGLAPATPSIDHSFAQID